MSLRATPERLRHRAAPVEPVEARLAVLKAGLETVTALLGGIGALLAVVKAGLDLVRVLGCLAALVAIFAIGASCDLPLPSLNQEATSRTARLATPGAQDCEGWPPRWRHDPADVK
jgi:hypothetical protein